MEAQTIHTVAQLKRAIRKAKAVYASVLVLDCDPSYIQVVKSDLLTQIENWDNLSKLSFCRVDEDGYLYIN